MTVEKVYVRCKCMWGSIMSFLKLSYEGKSLAIPQNEVTTGVISAFFGLNPLRLHLKVFREHGVANVWPDGSSKFPEIKNGKQRVVLKPWESKMPSLFQVGRYKASLFFTGRVSCCPYCEQTDHLRKDCSRKHEEMLYVRQTWPFPEPGQLHWPERHGRYDRHENTSDKNNEVRNNNDNTLPEEMDVVPTMSTLLLSLKGSRPPAILH